MELWQDDSPVVDSPPAKPKRGRSSRDCAKPVLLHYLLLGMRYTSLDLTTATSTILPAMCSCQLTSNTRVNAEDTEKRIICQTRHSTQQPCGRCATLRTCTLPRMEQNKRSLTISAVWMRVATRGKRRPQTTKNNGNRRK